MIALRKPVAKRCPYRDELDIGDVDITLDAEDAPELHALAEAIDEVGRDPVGLTHEEFTRRVVALIDGPATVTTTWKTGGWVVVISRDVPVG